MAFHGHVTRNHKKENSQCEEGGAGRGKQDKKQTCRRTHRRVSIQRFDAECDWQVNVTGKKESELVSTHLFPSPFFFFLFLLIQNTSNYVSSPSLLRFIFFGRSSETNTHGQEPRPHHQFQKRKNQFQTPKKKRERGEGVGGCQKKPLVLFSSRVLDCLLKLDSCSLQSLCSPQCTQKRRLQRKQTKKGRHEAFFVSLPSRHRWIDE
jgi:hypothetical protein